MQKELINFGFDLISGQHSELQFAGTVRINPYDFHFLFDSAVSFDCNQIHNSAILKRSFRNTTNKLCLHFQKRRRRTTWSTLKSSTR